MKTNHSSIESEVKEVLEAVFNEGMAYQVASLKDFKDLKFMHQKEATEAIKQMMESME